MAIGNGADDSVHSRTRYGQVTALLEVGGEPERWAACVTSLLAADVRVCMLLEPGTTLAPELELAGASVSLGTLQDEAVQAFAQEASAIVVAHQPVVVPLGAFGPALEMVAQEPRIATVSFFSNIANYLSFPRRNAPSASIPAGHNEETLTALLRATQPRIAAPVPVPVPAGLLVMVTRTGYFACRGFTAGIASAEHAVIELSLRAAARGLWNVLDTRTYVVAPLPPPPRIDAIVDEAWRARLTRAHPGFPALYDQTRDDPRSPIADVIALTRARAFGLDIAIDASSIGPNEMGTQVALLSQVSALAEHPGVRALHVGTPLGGIPKYARRALSHPKISVCDVEGGGFPSLDDVDVLHRPFQPDSLVPIERWRHISRRSVVTVQDLIAYENGDYFERGEDWLNYRRTLAASVSAVDAVVAISQDTRAAIERAQLPVEASRLRVILNGTDHLTGTSSGLAPRALRERAEQNPFIVVLGASYDHKNRDLAIRAWSLLREEGLPHDLVLAGFVVPFGRGRDHEALAKVGAPAPIVLADVPTEERDWLLKNAALVLYPTSAEGFGLIPFEAAAFGTPSLFVRFGPLAETLGEVPVAANEWSPESIAEAMRTLLNDPGAASAQVEAVRRAGRTMTWRDCADQLVEICLDALAEPRKADGLQRELARARREHADAVDRLRSTGAERTGRWRGSRIMELVRRATGRMRTGR